MDAFAKLGIDWQSILIYLVNFGIIVFVVKKYLSGPIINLLEDRTNKIDRNLKEAARLKKELRIQADRARHEQSKLQSVVKDELRKLNREFELKRKALEGEIEMKRNKELEKLAADLEQRRVEVMQSLEGDIKDLSISIASKILKNGISPEHINESANEAWKESQK